ncbi:MAG: hypothetical protein V4510_06210 [bacterium]
MHGIIKPRQTELLVANKREDVGPEATTLHFLNQARHSALGHFDHPRTLFATCFTARCDVPGRAGAEASTGSIVVHVSHPLFKEWAATATGLPAARRAHVIEQLGLVLQDLSDHDVHVVLALTDAQCEVYGKDLIQLVNESLNRTTFARLGRSAKVHWEGTLVQSMTPPSIVAVVSLGF